MLNTIRFFVTRTGNQRRKPSINTKTVSATVEITRSMTKPILTVRASGSLNAWAPETEYSGRAVSTARIAAQIKTPLSNFLENARIPGSSANTASMRAYTVQSLKTQITHCATIQMM